ncbi:hypothetical protein LCGC14_0569580 [marine sediment metagenome]|uniref:Uncharacterized protein n=1 Tax=marine sediment metagenome TaxID=412755 RepID=A0A0F9RPQ7_9ZZZZ
MTDIIMKEFVCVSCSHSELEPGEKIIRVAHIRIRADDDPTNYGWIKEADTFWMCPDCSRPKAILRCYYCKATTQDLAKRRDTIPQLYTIAWAATDTETTYCFRCADSAIYGIKNEHIKDPEKQKELIKSFSTTAMLDLSQRLLQKD